MRSNTFVLAGAAVLTVWSCTIRPPDVIVTSEKTALENQLLGSNRRITEDPVSVTAVWSREFVLNVSPYQVGGQATNPDETKTRQLIIAQIRRQTIQDHLDQLKKSGYIGEKSNGLMTVMSDTIGSYDEVERVVAAENSDRAVIWEYYASVSGEDPQKLILSIRNDFAEIMARVSPTGTWIEDQQGNWARK